MEDLKQTKRFVCQYLAIILRPGEYQKGLLFDRLANEHQTKLIINQFVVSGNPHGVSELLCWL